MYRRLIILSLIIIAALCGLSWLGYRAVSMWTQGIEGTRISEFADVAEQIRFDVNETLDAFREQEQKRPYTDYQYYSISGDPYLENQETQAAESSDRTTSNSSRGFSFQEPQNNYNNMIQQVTLRRSPLADNIEHDLAYFNFQYDKDSDTLTSPNGSVEQQQSQITQDESRNLNELVGDNLINIRENLLPAFEKYEDIELADISKKLNQLINDSKSDLDKNKGGVLLEVAKEQEESNRKPSANIKTNNKTYNNTRTGNYNIEGLQNNNGEPLVQRQSRDIVASNVGQNDLEYVNQQVEILNSQQQGRESQTDSSQDGLNSLPTQTGRTQTDVSQQALQRPMGGGRGGRGGSTSETARGGYGGNDGRMMGGYGGGMMGGYGGMGTNGVGGRVEPEPANVSNSDQALAYGGGQWVTNQPVVADPNQADIVEVIIEPFSTIVIPEENNKDSIFGGQVFMVRRVKIEGKELYQGFQLNEKKLLEKVEESTKRFVREGMSYELGRKQNENSAYTAILDFGFGHLLLNLFEDDPGRSMAQIRHLRTWYFSIIAVVFLAVTLAMVSLWLNAREQILLAQKKDDFVSAVSHELRTPLTSIRMHAEMLEKNWIKSQDKLGEYYRSMRTESERLSRLIENVLDFSRIQKGRKKYMFKLGDINKCVADVVEMMRAYAAQRGFQIQMQPGQCGEITFDSDAVTQIVVNLIDNAVKYSSNSEDKTVTVRTKSDGGYVLIEVEDHGPGIPHRQRKKVFQEFYRIGAESTRETTGSGLGLALVKRFAQAHNGFVEIINARPTGAIFRVSLATKL